MEEKTPIQILNEDLENLEKKIMLIGTADPEKYQEFLRRLKEIQESTLGMTTSNFHDAKYNIIKTLTALQLDFDDYMNGTEQNSMMSKSEPGKTKIKKHRINLYLSIVEDLEKLSEIDIEKLKTLRQKWNEEKQNEYLDYLPIEISTIEEAISKAFLDYQIKYIQLYGTLPQENITDYTSLEEYKSRIKEMLLKRASDTTLDSKSKLDIEKYLAEDNMDNLLKDNNFWKILSQTNTSFTKTNIDTILPENSNLPMVISKNKSKHLYMTCTIVQKGLFGKIKEKTIKIKIKDGVTYIPKKYKEKLLSATIPEGIKNISLYTFADAINLKQVSLPSTIQEIKEYAFQNCSSLTEINFPNALKKIGDFAFSGCHNLENIEFPSELSYIGQYSFANTAIRELDFSKYKSENELFIGQAAFLGCRNLEKVTLSERITYLRSYLFRSCKALKEIIFSKGLTGMGVAVFQNCVSLTEIKDLPETVTTIDYFCFASCINLKKFKMPTFLKYLDSKAFDANKMFDHFVLPKQLMNVSIIENLALNPECVLEIPEDAHGYLYTRLGLKPGDKISYSEILLKIADKKEKEIEIEPRIEHTMQRLGSRYIMKTTIEDPPVIVDVSPQAPDTPENEEPDDIEL